MGNNFVNLTVSNKYNKTDNNSELRNTKGLLIYNPKQLFAKLKQLKPKFISENKKYSKRLFKRKRA